MSTWISERGRQRLTAAAAAGSLGLTALAGCLPAGGEVTRSATLEIADRAVVVAGPPGFCVDPVASRTGGPAFALLGSCAALDPRPGAPRPDVRAMLTVTLAERGAAGPVADSADLLEGFFRSEDGRAALSRRGEANTVEVLESFRRGDLFVLHARDRSTGVAPGLATDYWRGYFDIEAGIVSVSVLGFEDAPLSRESGLDTLDAFIAAIRQRNPG